MFRLSNVSVYFQQGKLYECQASFTEDEAY